MHAWFGRRRKLLITEYLPSSVDLDPPWGMWMWMWMWMSTNKAQDFRIPCGTTAGSKSRTATWGLGIHGVSAEETSESSESGGGGSVVVPVPTFAQCCTTTDGRCMIGLAENTMMVTVIVACFAFQSRSTERASCLHAFWHRHRPRLLVNLRATGQLQEPSRHTISKPISKHG
ncbi:hypothetical protein LZ554_006930 [Drepanopeziza brunnea f. sp. 'monogermtubi']|nr:hypothetical protein LZ554_006930 [Drepanopeziza brunnea f. sp. 'monogermtubi']